MKLLADKQTVLDQAWAKAEEWLLDTGEGLDSDGNPNERELKSRREELEAALGKVWDECVAEFYEDALEKFIEENREALTAGILDRIASCDGDPAGPDDDDIEQRILNDEGLYNWAKSEGAVE